MEREMGLSIAFMIISLIFAVIGFLTTNSLWFIRSGIFLIATIFLIWRGKIKK
ncbi:MAG: hypothetical protein NUV97_00185 [archaeon]|nr:hypothetical protein [archaeon]MCR4323596.1 hypothetical protein [Nanoarchaeota archaeon]